MPRQICNCGAEIINGAYCTNGHVQNRELRDEMGDRVYGSAIAFGLAAAGLVVLLVMRAVIGL